MKLKKIIGLVLVIVLIQASISFAGTAKKAGEKEKKYAKSDLKAGTTEVSASFLGTYATATVTPFIGYFVTDEIEIGGGFLVETGDFEGNDYTTTALLLLGRYNVPIEQNLIVFGEVGINQVNVDQDSKGYDYTAFTIGVGGRIFPSKAFSLNIMLDYVIASFDTTGQDIDTDALRLGLGLSVFIF